MSEMIPPQISPAAWEQWLAEAKTRGFGKYMFGSVYAGGDKPDHMTIHFHTLVLASYYATDDAMKASPVLFTRDADNDIILPGRWWQELVAWAPAADTILQQDRQQFAQDVAGNDLVNAIVPRQHAASHSLLASLPAFPGGIVVQEVLYPGTEAFISFPKKWLDLLKGGAT